MSGATSAAEGPPRLRLVDVVKDYSGARALNELSMECRAGEVVGLVGHNGAGKSTVSKLVAGLERPDSGEIQIDGKTMRLRSAEDGIKAGVGLVPQRLAVAGVLTVRENLLLGHRAKKGGTASGDQVREVATELGIVDALDHRAGTLRPAAQRLVMIARALLRDPSLLILDEPTAAFSAAEVERLFEIARGLKARGIAIIYVSHRLEEVLQLCDHITSLSQGKMTANAPSSTFTKESLADLMAGRHVESLTKAEHPAGAAAGRGNGDAAEVVLRCRNISVGAKLQDVNLEVRRGEVVGLTGLVGSGRTTLLEGICGVGVAPFSGEVEVDGKRYVPHGMRRAIRRGVAFLPENRARNSIFPAMTVRENVSLPTIRAYGPLRSPLVNRRREGRVVKESLEKLSVQPPNAMELPMTALSGGNQQKALLARWLLTEIEVFVMDEPTEGVDVHGRAEIYKLIDELAEGGRGVLLSSSDVEEVVDRCDRVLVMHSGSIAEEISGADLTVDRVSRACIA